MKTSLAPEALNMAESRWYGELLPEKLIDLGFHNKAAALMLTIELRRATAWRTRLFQR